MTHEYWGFPIWLVERDMVPIPVWVLSSIILIFSDSFSPDLGDFLTQICSSVLKMNLLQNWRFLSVTLSPLWYCFLWFLDALFSPSFQLFFSYFTLSRLPASVWVSSPCIMTQKVSQINMLGQSYISVICSSSLRGQCSSLPDVSDKPFLIYFVYFWLFQATGQI